MGKWVQTDSRCIYGIQNRIGNATPGTLAARVGFIGAGEANVIETNATDQNNSGAIVNGKGNIIDPATEHGFIGNGSNNSAFRFSATVVNGLNNRASGDFSFVGNGGNAGAPIGNLADATYAFIGTGHCNEVHGDFSYIGDGYRNAISTGSTYSIIGTGLQNLIGSPAAGSLGALYSVIGGGQQNLIDTDAVANTLYNTIGGGFGNQILLQTNGATIGGGLFNTASGYINTVSGGYSNTASGSYSTVSGGYTNQALANFATIGGGQFNRASGNFGFIGGGDTNTISTGYLHSSIVGGDTNTINGNCSVILGGSGNTVNHNWAAVFGNGINSVRPNTLHVECVNAINTPVAYAVSLPVGTIFGDSGTPPAGCAVPLYIRI